MIETKITVIIGPQGSGKTRLAKELIGDRRYFQISVFRLMEYKLEDTGSFEAIHIDEVPEYCDLNQVMLYIPNSITFIVFESKYDEIIIPEKSKTIKKTRDE